MRREMEKHARQGRARRKGQRQRGGQGEARYVRTPPRLLPQPSAALIGGSGDHGEARVTHIESRDAASGAMWRRKGSSRRRTKHGDSSRPPGRVRPKRGSGGSQRCVQWRCVQCAGADHGDGGVERADATTQGMRCARVNSSSVCARNAGSGGDEDEDGRDGRCESTAESNATRQRPRLTSATRLSLISPSLTLSASDHKVRAPTVRAAFCVEV